MIQWLDLTLCSSTVIRYINYSETVSKISFATIELNAIDQYLLCGEEETAFQN
jgi:hypothetical protein